MIIVPDHDSFTEEEEFEEKRAIDPLYPFTFILLL